MELSPNEAEQALASIQQTMAKTRQSFARSSGYVFLVINGVVWLVGFLATQFLSGDIVPAIWIGVSVLGSALSIPLGMRLARRVHMPSASTYGRRIGMFWVLLICFSAAIIAVARPTDGKQMTLMIVLFVMIGQLAMSLLFSFGYSWWALPIGALALAGYYLLPGYFYLWMGLLVGGGMIALGLYIRLKWGGHAGAE